MFLKATDWELVSFKINYLHCIKTTLKAMWDYPKLHLTIFLLSLQDAKTRFKSVVVDTALKSTVAGAFRRASLERQRSRESSTNSDVFLPEPRWVTASHHSCTSSVGRTRGCQLLSYWTGLPRSLLFLLFLVALLFWQNPYFSLLFWLMVKKYINRL